MVAAFIRLNCCLLMLQFAVKADLLHFSQPALLISTPAAMLPERNLSESENGLSWDDMGFGAPTIIGLARLCSNRLASGTHHSEGLSIEAQAILYAARDRGVIGIKATDKAFDAVDRFLVVYVETDLDRAIAFKNKNDPRQTIKFLDAFRELCSAGLVFHHLQREFSLNGDGFKAAESIEQEHVEETLSFAMELGLHEW